ncbi:GIY-YIG nuclease family protein [Clostridium botulinum]|uniref:GIY-YIG nuclease family protein n=2 Tax=Clostridium botulinum TaxID=1491 RepID=UPI001FA6F5F1|nr:GIY-YIG nuclease family protein [Clostridium botulinum]
MISEGVDIAMKMKAIGIYGIEDVETGNIYVGQSTDIGKRWSNHDSFLKAGKHKYKKLQEAYNLDCKRIKYTILEECSREKLQEREEFWMEYVKKIDGWTLINKQPYGGVNKKVTDTSNMKKAQQGVNNGNCKYDIEIIIEIKEMINMGLSNTEISKKTGINRNYISQIRTGQKWSSVNILPI